MVKGSLITILQIIGTEINKLATISFGLESCKLTVVNRDFR